MSVVQVRLEEWLRRAPVVPILTVTDVETAVHVARALVAGGLPVIEVTLRTPQALEAIRAMAGEVPDAIVGAGTLLNATQVDEARGAGAQFGVSPGWTDSLLEAAAHSQFPLLPGASTASDAMHLRERGWRILKFFPAAACDGVAWLKSVAAPLADLRFCPTGGIDAASAPDYLELPNVIAVGGSWLAPSACVAARNWRAIEDLARNAARMRIE